MIGVRDDVRGCGDILGLWLRSVTGTGAVRVSLPGGRPVPGPAVSGRDSGIRNGRRWSGRGRPADADLGGRGAGGDGASGGGEGRPGFGLAVAVPVPAGDDAAFA